MPKPALKKRHVQSVDTNTMNTDANLSLNGPTIRHPTSTHTVTIENIQEWQQESRSITRGYRLGKASYRECVNSLTFLHNETCSTYTHLIPALLLPVVANNCLKSLSAPQFRNVLSMDYLMMGIFFCCAECCLTFSTLYHLLACHSYGVDQFWLRMDLLGIILATVGTFIPGIYWAFTCDPAVQKLHWTIIIISGSITAILVCMPRFRRWHTARTTSLIALGGSAIIPILHSVSLYGIDYMVRYSSLKLYLIEMSFYAVGALFFATRIPERFVPGTFDIFGASHQLFHVTVVCGMCLHISALYNAFEACHTLDLCKIKTSLGVNS